MPEAPTETLPRSHTQTRLEMPQGQQYHTAEHPSQGNDAEDTLLGNCGYFSEEQAALLGCYSRDA